MAVIGAVFFTRSSCNMLDDSIDDDHGVMSIVTADEMLHDGLLRRVGRRRLSRLAKHGRVVFCFPCSGTSSVSYTHLTLPTICSV